MTLLQGVCFYLLQRLSDIRRENDWTNLVSNSGKLVNTITAHRFNTVLRRTSDCVDHRLHGRTQVSATIHVKRAWGPTVEGEALVLREGFSARYDLDRTTGVISRIGHSAEGTSVADRILVIPTVKGGVAGGWAFLDMQHKGIAPKALVFGRLNPVVVQGAVLAKMPVTEGWFQDALDMIRTGDRIRVDPAPKTVAVVSRRSSEHD